MELSDQQLDIIGAPIESLSVIACAGSGKTTAAVHRLIRLRQALVDERGYVALLSFSNVAVNTFRQVFLSNLSLLKKKNPYFDRVVIETLDSFVVSNILRPHSPRTMQCSKTPFLITGTEPFLGNGQFKFRASPKSGNEFPIPPKDIESITFRLEGKGLSAYLKNKKSLIKIDGWKQVIERLGSQGAYTHEFGKYWALRTLSDNKNILNAFARRYPHIIVDEAQDIDCLHGCILNALSQAGVKISLIGDPHQAIFEFAGADGVYLKEFNAQASTISLPLTINRRSIESIVDVSSNISGAKLESTRECKGKGFGAYYCVYEEGLEKDLIGLFYEKVLSLNIPIDDSAILVRKKDLMRQLRGANSSVGQGNTHLLAMAAIKRDVEADYVGAFNLLLSGINSLIKDSSKEFKSKVLASVKPDTYHQTKSLIWRFVRCSRSGLPSASLSAKAQWHPNLKTNITTLLNDICNLHGFEYVDKLGNKIASTDLPDGPLDSGVGSGDSFVKIRVDTVHQSKGEGIKAVMYIATNDHAEKLIKGTDTELGRIGYVAVTRARDYFVLAIPEKSEKALLGDLNRIGLRKW